MGMDTMSLAGRKRATTRLERREGKRALRLEFDEAMNPSVTEDDIQLVNEPTNRELVLMGINPNTAPLTLYPTVEEFDAAVERLPELTFQERQFAASTAFHMGYTADMEHELSDYVMNDLLEQFDHDYMPAW